ncbi:MAG: DUF1045 domain-containing protein [Pseudomonadota bacterium]
MDAEDRMLAEAPSPYVDAPRRYGFHATLKAPMRLANGTAYADLVSAVDKLAGKMPPAELGILMPKRMGGFLALVCDERFHDGASSIAWQCVSMLDRLRAELSDQEHEKHCNLTEEQGRNLHLWGYPYVGRSFRFHMTLTSHLSDVALEQAGQTIKAIVPKEKTILDSICLFGDPGGTKPFVLLERFDLSG